MHGKPVPPAPALAGRKAGEFGDGVIMIALRRFP
jgi:hypothetical protein